MKKNFVVASALLMCCMFMGCGVKAQLVGTWKSSSTEVSSNETIKNDVTFIINKDGTYSHDVVFIITNTDDESQNLKSIKNTSGYWYYSDNSDKVILKITNSSEQYNDEDPEVDNNVNYKSAEIVLVDDILFVDNNWNGILEFTKAE